MDEERRGCLAREVRAIQGETGKRLPLRSVVGPRV